MSKRILSFALTFCILLSYVMIGGFASVKTDAAQVDIADTDASINYGLVDNVQYGQILHCWNWSFDNIRKNMQRIASQGFTAIQTSPIQSSKESTRESWSSVQNSAWVYYQPISFNIEQNSWNALGTKTEFEAMCKEAHKYGVKVIVDTVFNHMANDYTENTINGQIPSDLRNDSSCWYSITWNTSNWEDRYDVTHNCLSGFPDLNTSSSKVQNYAIGFLKECIDAGADGFRFDAAKHIETPADAYGTASDFWPNVLGTATYHAQQTRGITPYYYGEILGAPGGGLSITAYTDHMSVTDNNTGNTIRDAIASGNASGACIAGISNGAAPDKAVQWNESHDTYYADNNSIWISNDNMKKTWAIVGTRAKVCGLYLARPENNETTMLGDGDITAWADKEVKAINRFKNYFAGHGEYLACSGNIVYNERGNTGVVLVNAAGGKTSVSVPAHRMYDGTYTDAITGNHFYVSNGTISGEIGSSGIAVVYSYPSTVHANKSSQAFRGDTLSVTLTYDEATGGTYTIGDEYTQKYTYGDVVSVGCGVEYGEQVDMLVTASGGTTTDSMLLTYKKLHPDTDLKMYFNNSSKNWDTVYAYVYNSDGGKNKSWPGEQMTYDSSLGLWVYDVPAGFETSKVVFNDGGDNQTPSSGGHSFNAYTSIYKDGSFYGYNTGVKDKLYFKPSSNWLSDKARFAVYVWNGSKNSWVNFTDSDGDGIYVANLPSGTWTECIFARMDPSTTSNNWDNIWNQTDDMGISNNHNYFMIANGWDTSDGAWSILDESVVGTESDAQLVGTFNNWDTKANPFVYTHYKTAVTTVDLPAGTYTFKLLKNDNWFGNPGVISDATVGTGWRMCKNDSESCTINATGGTYTFTLDTEELRISVDFVPGDVELENPTDAPTEVETDAPTEAETENSVPAGYYLVGILDGEEYWSVDSFTEDRMFVANPFVDGEYGLDYTFVKGDEIKVVYYNGNEITRWYNSSGDNYSIGSSKAGDCTVYFRPSGNDDWSYYYFTVLPRQEETEAPTDPPTEEITQPTIEDGYYLVGTIGGKNCWSVSSLSEDRKFAANPKNQGEYKLDYTFVKGDELKVVKLESGKITRWYNSTGDNYSIGSTKAGDCTVYFRPEGDNAWSYFYFTVLPKVVEETEAPTEAPTEPPLPKVENVQVSFDESTQKFTVTWDEIESAPYYWVYFTYNGKTSVGKTPGTTSYSYKYIQGVEYEFRVIAKLADGQYLEVEDADAVIKTAPVKSELPKVENVQVSFDESTQKFTVTWDEIESAPYYWVYFTYNGKTSVGKTPGTTSYSYKYIQGVEYEFRVIAKLADGQYLEVEDADAVIKTAPVKSELPKIENVQVTFNYSTQKFTVTWDEIKGAPYYWVYFTYNGKTSVGKTPGTTSYSYKYLEGVEYEFRVIAQLADGQYMEVEDADAVTYTAPIRLVVDPTAQATSDSVTLTWDHIEGSTMHWVYLSKDNGATYSTNPVKSTTTDSASILNLLPNTIYYFKVISKIDGRISTVEDAKAVYAYTGNSSSKLNLTVDKTATSITTSWIQYKNATKYYVTYKDLNNVGYSYKTTELTHTVTKNIKPNTTYNVMLEAIYTDDKGETQIEKCVVQVTTPAL